MGEPYALNCTAVCVMGPLISPANPLQILAHCQAVLGTRGPELQRHEVPSLEESAEGQCAESLWSLIASLCLVKASDSRDGSCPHLPPRSVSCFPPGTAASPSTRDPRGLWETTFSALSTHPAPMPFFSAMKAMEDFDAQGASEVRQSQGPDLLTKPLTLPSPLALNQDRSPGVTFSTFVSYCLVQSF